MANVGVILDWRRAERRSAWEQLFNDADPALEVSFYPIADLIVAPEDQGLAAISKEDVLIINWDAANGDPEFGGHLCQRWLGHRRPEIIEWVRRGGILLIESQATLGVPCAAAYDAAVGRGELPTSGLDDPTQPLQSVAPRSGTAARKTSRFPTGFGFGAVRDQIVVHTPYRTHELFPSTTTGLLRDLLERADPGPLLWRGVFRRTLPFTRQFPWISIIETDSAPLYRQSVMLVAKVGDGAIFATTMMLALTGQVELVRAIVACAGGNTFHLPKSIAPAERVRTAAKLLLAVFGGIVVAGIVNWLRAEPLTSIVFKRPGLLQSVVENVVQLVLFALGAATALGLYRLYRRLRRFIRNIVGA